MEILYKVGNIASRSCSPAHSTLLPIGINTITCTATDNAGNVGTASFTVTVVLEEVIDTTPPVITVSNLNLSTTNSGGFEVDYISNSAFPNLAGYPITAIDTVTNSTGSYSQQLIPNCTSPDLASDFSWRMVLDWTLPDEILGWNGPFFFNTFSTGQGDFTFPVGTTTLTCTATDYAGNTGSASFDVVVNYNIDDAIIPNIAASAYLNDTSINWQNIAC